MTSLEEDIRVLHEAADVLAAVLPTPQVLRTVLFSRGITPVLVFPGQISRAQLEAAHNYKVAYSKVSQHTKDVQTSRRAIREAVQRCTHKWGGSYLTFKITSCTSILPYTMLAMAGCQRIATKGKGWNIQWGNVVLRPRAYQDMAQHQRTNQWPGFLAISRKDSLERTIATLKGNGSHPSLNFLPVTFNLPQQLPKLLDAATAQPQGAWILKPSSASQGRGIQVASSAAILKSARHARREELRSTARPGASPSSSTTPMPGHAVAVAAAAAAAQRAQADRAGPEASSVYSRGSGSQAEDDDDDELATVLRDASLNAATHNKLPDAGDGLQAGNVACQYLNRVLLVDGFKFDLRLYVLVTGWDPLRIYLHRHGLARFATTAYSSDPASLGDRFMHLTNYSVNKHSAAYHAGVSGPGRSAAVGAAADEEVADLPRLHAWLPKASSGHKWSLPAMQAVLAGAGVDVDALWAEMESLVVHTILAMQDQVRAAIARHVPWPHDNGFQLFGFDVLVDEQLKPWLLEVNFAPSLAVDADLDLQIKSNVLGDMFTTVGVPVVDSGGKGDIPGGVHLPASVSGSRAAAAAATAAAPQASSSAALRRPSTSTAARSTTTAGAPYAQAAPRARTASTGTRSDAGSDAGLPAITALPAPPTDMAKVHIPHTPHVLQRRTAKQLLPSVAGADRRMLAALDAEADRAGNFVRVYPTNSLNPLSVQDLVPACTDRDALAAVWVRQLYAVQLALASAPSASAIAAEDVDAAVQAHAIPRLDLSDRARRIHAQQTRARSRQAAQAGLAAAAAAGLAPHRRASDGLPDVQVRIDQVQHGKQLLAAGVSAPFRPAPLSETFVHASCADFYSVRVSGTSLGATPAPMAAGPPSASPESYTCK